MGRHDKGGQANPNGGKSGTFENESVASIMATTTWKAKQCSNPLGLLLFDKQTPIKVTRFGTSNEIRPPVPGYHTLPSNITSRIWNDIPELQNAKTLAAAKRVSRKYNS